MEMYLRVSPARRIFPENAGNTSARFSRGRRERAAIEMHFHGAVSARTLIRPSPSAAPSGAERSEKPSLRHEIYSNLFLRQICAFLEAVGWLEYESAGSTRS